MTREQQYQYEQYMRRQQLLRNYAKIGACGFNQEQHRKENPSTQQDILDGLSDVTVKNMTISKEITLSGDSLLVDSGRELTMTLNDTITAPETMTEDSAIIVQNGAKLTINNGIDGNGGVDATDNTVALKLTRAGGLSTETAELTINGGVFKGGNYAVSGNGKRQNTKVVINDGTFEGTVENDSLAIFNPQDGELTINGGTFSGANTVWVKCGTITINNGSFYADGISAAYLYKTGFSNTGDCLVVDNCGYPGGDINISVMGGYFYSENANPIASYSANGYEALSGFVYGGTFNKKIDDSLVAEGYEQVSSATGEWKVVKEA